MTSRAKILLIINDDRSVRILLEQALTQAEYHVLLTDSAIELCDWIEAGQGDVVITDVSKPEIILKIKRLNPSLPILTLRALSNFATDLRIEKENFLEYMSKPFDLDKLILAVRHAIHSRQEKNNLSLIKDFDEKLPLIGKSLFIRNIYQIIARLTNYDLNVLLYGEGGTGKHFIARILHDHSPRNSYPFVSINLSVLDEKEVQQFFFPDTHKNLIQSNIFERCENGTLYLENIELLPLITQKRIIHWIENQSKFNRLRRNEFSTRIISATEVNLLHLVQQGKFREDLYYHLNSVPINVPSLRERTEDIPSLVCFFLSKYNFITTVTDGGIDALKRYSWPGNIKELENFIRRLSILYPNQIISEDLVRTNLNIKLSLNCDRDINKSLPLSLLIERYIRRYFLESKGLRVSKLYAQMIAEIEKPLIEQTLLETQGNQIKASAILGINRNTLRKRIRELNILFK
ncbi:DNA-binding transcriptional regulator NtrC [Commensalibacter sp. Nvir]|uniref:sigma-54-dependent transcriptional regulator n=1 Tax=Commensalibacter sp. Nvir TaxID=3069817 RepID=UPI002D5091B6|nr:DNA-binding transcriptional regulator NtrC [Commensalibacter sp. Nvir]